MHRVDKGIAGALIMKKIVKAKIESSRKRRIKYVKIPSGIALRRIQKKPKARTCIQCKKPLHGISNVINKLQKKLSKSKKRPERRFAGVLCSQCSRRELISRIRMQDETGLHRVDKGDAGSPYEEINSEVN